MGLHFLFALTGILLLAYALLIFYYHRAWDQIPSPTESSGIRDMDFPLRVSVIIPARNEAGNITNCLDSLQAQSYAKNDTEIIVVNDFSTDETALLVMKHP